MLKYPQLIIFVFLLGCLLCVSNVYAANRNAASASYADVSAAVSAAASGDTVLVPAGSATWSSTLSITKGITLKGAGIGSTVITDSSGAGLINYSPNSTAISNDESFEVSGFTFNENNGAAYQILLINADVSPVITKVNIHDNRFTNGGSNRGIRVSGTIYGVAHSNQFDMIWLPLAYFGGDQNAWLANLPIEYGTARNFYFEDNTISFSGSFTNDHGWIEIGQGGRVVVRYNTWNLTNARGGETWDIHGNQNTCNQTGTMVSEWYGNAITNAATGYWHRWMRDANSWMVMFNNSVSGAGASNFGINWDQRACDSDCQSLYGHTWPQHIRNTYLWNNVAGGTKKDMTLNENDCGTYTVTENTDFFADSASCTSSSCSAGIGCGASPPTGTCTTGVGYWVTSFSPCTSPPSTMADVKTYSQAGTLYKCTSTNTWTPFYKPYAYPHPLRAGTNIFPGVPGPVK